jgi:p-hydroxybenzoic acid efflux pump subunit AaeB
MFSIASYHVRFALKLACAIVLALFVGFHFNWKHRAGQY